MFCPLCQSEYREGFTRCTDCDVPLVPERIEQPSESDSSPSPEDAPVLLWRGGNPVEFTALQAALHDAGIEFEEITPRDYENTISSRTADRLFYGIPNFDIRVRRIDLAEGQRILESVQHQLSQEVELGNADSGEKPLEKAVDIAEQQIAEDWDRSTANVEVWAGDDEGQAQFLMDTFRENHIPCRTVEGSETARPVLILVRPQDESRAREILREITEGTPLT